MFNGTWAGAKIEEPFTPPYCLAYLIAELYEAGVLSRLDMLFVFTALR